MKKYKYKISVVMPIYKVEEYLDEAITSVINQTLDFKNNIQLILINDGSPDNSEVICLKYQKLYPQNVIYIKQVNSGVSSARNKGLEYAEGEYVNFLDSDDKWSLTAFEEGYEFFQKNPDINLISFRMHFFEARTNYHPLDYKFDCNKVVNIFQDYSQIQFHITSSLIRTSAIGDIRFDTKVKYSEDTKFVMQIILESGKLGIISSSEHYYRKRFSETSAIQNCRKDRCWYFDSINYVWKELINVSKHKYKKVILYLQYSIMYELRYRLSNSLLPDDFTSLQAEQYKGLIRDLLKSIDDEIIIDYPKMDLEFKYYALNLKYGKNISKYFKLKEDKIWFRNFVFFELKKAKALIDIMEIKKDILHMEGNFFYMSLLEKKDCQIYFYLNDEKKIKVNYLIRKDKIRNSLGEQVVKFQEFIVDIPLKGVKKIALIIKVDNTCSMIPLSFSRLTKLNNMRYTYGMYGNYILTINKNKIKVTSKNFLRLCYCEFKYLLNLLKLREWKVIIFRIIYFVFKIFKHKELWLLSDRIMVTGDNGIAFFKYLSKNYPQNTKIYFTLSNKSRDYYEIKKIGKVLNQDSFRYKIKFLLSNKIISSQADDYVTNAFGNKMKFYQNLYDFQFVFLQHGVIKDDLSEWLNKYKKNIKMFVTSAQKEYDSIIKGKYYYSDQVVKLTGLPRYDFLHNDNLENLILIMPTWRKNIAGKIIKNNIRDYNSDFTKTDFFIQYNKLLNDPKLLAILKKYNYKVKFCLHTLMLPQTGDFNSNDYVEIVENCNYRDEFCRAKLLITDFSSVAFDFGYLNKPVLFFQFDIDTFYDGHSYDRGYFSYEKHAFGPICYKRDELIKKLIDFIKTDCKLEKKYAARINNFYANIDNNNCKRVYDEIMKLNKKNDD